MFSFLRRHDKATEKTDDITAAENAATIDDTATTATTPVSEPNMHDDAFDTSTSPAPATEPDTHDDATDMSDESITPSTVTDDMCDDASSQSDTDEHITETEDNIRDDVAQDTESICDDVQPSDNMRDGDANICDDNIYDTVIDVSTCENANTDDTAADSNICDDASDMRDVQRDDTDDTCDAADAVAHVSPKEDIYATLRFECGNDMSVTVDDDTVTISRDSAERDDASDGEHDADRPVGRHYIDAEAVLPGPEPHRYRGFMSYGRSDADEIADRCPASELDFDAILADYDRADHRMVRDVLDGLYGTMAESGEMSEGDPRPFPVYGGAAMPLNNWSWQDVNSVRKHIAHMPLPVVTGRANVTADIKVDDGVDEPQADADAVDSGSEAMHDVPFADGDKGGCDVSGGRHFKHVDVDDAAGTDAVMTPVTGAGSDEHDANEEGTGSDASRVSSLVDCGNGYFMYIDGGDDAAYLEEVNGNKGNGKHGTYGSSGRCGTGNAVGSGATGGVTRGMSDAVKIGCIAAMVIARKAARRMR